MGCGGGISIGDGDYVVLAVAVSDAKYSGNCPGQTVNSNVAFDVTDTWTAYGAPDNKAFLEVGSTTGTTGNVTLSGSSTSTGYSFSGTEQTTEAFGTMTNTTTTTATVTLTTTGDTFTGTAVYAIDTNGSTCTETITVSGTAVNGVQLQQTP
jgi:hypothetical protein